jgi:hypothetical protein
MLATLHTTNFAPRFPDERRLFGADPSRPYLHRARGIAVDRNHLASLPPGHGPTLLAVIDAEEEFDWSHFSTAATAVTAMRHQEGAQRLFDQHGLRPTYAVDYAVASQSAGYRPLQEFIADGICDIGAHLHPWINPPVKEELGTRASFPGNLPRALEFEKLRALTRVIEDTFGTAPELYRAGRYGTGPNTAGILDALGYTIDCSVLPWADLSDRHGPDYSQCTAEPFWFGRERRLLEIPVSVGLIGGLSRDASSLYQTITGPRAEKLKLPALFARLRLLDRIRITPEGTTLAEAKRVTRAMLRENPDQVFILSYHTPSLQPGNTPYTKTQRDVDRFLAWIADYLAFFFGEIGGTPSTPRAIHALARTELGIARPTL